MPGRLTIPVEHQAPLKLLRERGAQLLDGLNSAIGGVLLRRSDLELALRQAKSGESALLVEVDVPLLAELLVNLALLAGMASPRTLLADLAWSLRTGEKWSEAEVASWDALQPSLERLLANEALIALGKTIRLQYEHANILTETRVITDIRPVFSFDATKPIAAVICHTLRIAYTSEADTRHVAFALDTDDLRELVKVCERALTKADALSAYLKQPTALPSRIAGSDDATKA